MSESRAILHYAERPAHLPASLERASLASLPAARAGELRMRDEPARRLDSPLGIGLAVAAARAAGYDVEARLWPVEPGGRPRWPAGPEFSIAHAAGLVACAMLDDGAAVGCDIEAESAVAARDLRRVLDDAERRLLTRGALSPATLWTRKEAALKWAGLGLRQVRDVRVSGEGVTVAGRRLACRSVVLPQDVIASIASARPVAAVVVRHHDALALLEGLSTMPGAA
jgi:4'-phosphopantetheinyl transferase